jgi:hypothetical protein
MVYVFKTSVTTKVAIKKLAPLFDMVAFIDKWNFDLQDCDNILRIEAPEFDTRLIRELLIQNGFDCVELELCEDKLLKGFKNVDIEQ